MIERLITTYGYLAVFALMTAESALIPIPSEVTMTFAGFLSGVGHMNIWLVIFIGALGNLIGSLLAFWLGEKMGEEWIDIDSSALKDLEHMMSDENRREIGESVANCL